MRTPPGASDPRLGNEPPSAVSSDPKPLPSDEQRSKPYEQLAHVLLNTTPTSAFLVDLQGRVLSVNQEAAALTGVPIEHLPGRVFIKCFPPDAAEVWKLKSLEAMRTGKPVHFEDEAGGRVFSNSVHPVCGARGRVVSGPISRFWSYPTMGSP